MVFEGVPGGPLDCWGDVTRRRSSTSHAATCASSTRVRPVGSRAMPPTSSSPTTTACSPAASRPPSASRSPRCPPVARCSAWPTWWCSTTRSPARARTTRAKCADAVPREHPGARRRRGFDARVHAARPSTATGSPTPSSWRRWTNALLLHPAAACAQAARRRRRRAAEIAPAPSPTASTIRATFFPWFADPREGRPPTSPSSPALTGPQPARSQEPRRHDATRGHRRRRPVRHAARAGPVGQQGYDGDAR